MKRKIIIALSLLLLFSVNVYAGVFDGLTRSELRIEIRNCLGDTDTDNTYNLRWSSTTLNNRIEIAQVEIVARTWCLKSRKKCDTVEDQEEYILPDDCMAVERVCIEISDSATDYYKIHWATINKWDSDGQWEDNASGVPDEWCIRRNNRLVLNPPCNSTYTGTNKLRIDYIEIPDSFGADSSVPFNSAKRLYPYHHLIIWYVVAMCKQDEGKYSEADYYWKKFYVDIENMKKEIEWHPAQRGGIRPLKRYD